VRRTGATSPSVISALSAGAHPFEFGRDTPRRRDGIGEVDAGEPLHGAVQRDIGVKGSARLTMREDPLPRSEREHGAAADRLGRVRMPRVCITEVGLDERGADIFGLDV
jgi:hypothetical protein